MFGRLTYVQGFGGVMPVANALVYLSKSCTVGWLGLLVSGGQVG